MTLVDALWAAQIHELRMAAVELLGLYRGRLSGADMLLLERLLREAGTWALVDPLAASVAGPLTERHPEVAAVLDRWSRDQDFWIRRAALLAFLLPLRRGDGDFARFSTYADAMLGDKEFFMRKAIGWVLRDTARKRPDLVCRWLLPRAARASAVTIRRGRQALDRTTTQGRLWRPGKPLAGRIEPILASSSHYAARPASAGVACRRTSSRRSSSASQTMKGNGATMAS